MCEAMCGDGLTLSGIEAGEKDVPAFIVRYGRLMLRCVALAVINDRAGFTEERIAEESDWLCDNLTNYQVYELFAFVVSLAQLPDFTNTIRLIWTMKAVCLSPKKKQSRGSLKA
jgi:hypothetical protein